MKSETPVGLSQKLREIVTDMVNKHNQLMDARPEMGLRPYTFRDGLDALNEHRLAAFGRIDTELEAGRISPEEAQKQKVNWDINHSYK
jgi:hypothetical protein